MTITIIKEKALVAFKEVTFGALETREQWEEAKPLLWGAIIPWIMVGVFLSFLPLVIVPAVAALVQLTKGEKDKAAKTLGWTLAVPMIVLVIYFLSMILYIL